jgi:MFS family permease
LGHVSALLHLLFRGFIPVGAILGGLLADRVGVRQTMLLGIAGFLLSNAWLFFSPIRCLREIPVNR